MNRYSAYRDTGLPWLGEVPEHWDILPNISLFRERIERGIPDAELLSVTQSRGIIRQTELEEKKDSSNEDKSNYKRVRVGDLAYNKMRMWQGAVGYTEYDGIVSPAYIVLYPARMINLRYFYFLFKTSTYMTNSYRYSYGISDDQLSLRYKDFKRMYSLLPPRVEQDAIVAYLDRKLAEVDRFIAAKERLIALLAEQKAAIINQAITRGLDPSVPMKPSGIAWLGDIPAHWEVKRAKFLWTRIEQGWSPQCEARHKSENQWGVLKVGCVNGFTFDEMEHKALPLEIEPLKEYEIKHGDILISRANTRELVGSAAHVERVSPQMLLCDKLYRVALRRSRMDPTFFVHLLQSMSSRNQIELGASGASDSMQNIGQDVVKNLWIAFPEVREQSAICEYLAKEGKQIGDALSKTQREIELIREYRAALISDIVTGKIDVRAAVMDERKEEAVV